MQDPKFKILTLNQNPVFRVYCFLRCSLVLTLLFFCFFGSSGLFLLLKFSQKLDLRCLSSNFCNTGENTKDVVILLFNTRSFSKIEDRSNKKWKETPWSISGHPCPQIPISVDTVKWDLLIHRLTINTCTWGSHEMSWTQSEVPFSTPPRDLLRTSPKHSQKVLSVIFRGQLRLSSMSWHLLLVKSMGAEPAIRRDHCTVLA